MPHPASDRPRFNPAFRLYLAGLGLVFVGAWSIDLTGSLLPMSLASSAAVLLSLPYLRQRLARLRAARSPRPTRAADPMRCRK